MNRTATRARVEHRDVYTERRKRRPADIAGALIVALGAVVIAVLGFGVTNLLVVVAIAYAAFVATVAVVAYAWGGPRTVIDIRTEEERRQATLVSVPVASDTEPSEAPIRSRAFGGADFAEVLIAAVGATAFAELIRITTRMDSLVGFAVWWYIALVAIYYVLARDRRTREIAVDRVVTLLVWSTGVLVASVLVWMVLYVVVKGLQGLSATFFTEDMREVGPLTPGGGAKHAIIGTLQQVGIATIFVVPIGILTAVYLHEIQGRLARPVRFIVDAMSGLPSIVAGLLVFTVWVGVYGYSGLAGAFALAVLMLPTMTRATEEILRTVPDTLREGALALGSPHWRLVQRVVIPTALSGIVTAALLAIARAIGETAPLILTSFGADNTNTNPADGPQSALPLFVWKLIRVPDKTQNDRAWAGALVLIMIVFVLFVSARFIASRGTKKLEGRR